MSSIEQNSQAQRAGELLKELIGLIVKRSMGEVFHMHSLLSEADLSMPQMATVCMLHQMGPHSISKIASRLSLSLSATSHLVDRMVDKGFVERSEEKEDRRQKRIALSPTGHELAERVAEARATEAAKVLNVLPPELLAQFEQVISEVVDRLRKEHDDQAQDEPHSGE